MWEDGDGDVDGDGTAEVFVLSTEEGVVGRASAGPDGIGFPEAMRLPPGDVPVAMKLVDTQDGPRLAVIASKEKRFSLDLLVFDGGEPQVIDLGRATRGPDTILDVDADQDGFGAGPVTLSCSPMAGQVTNAADCDDASNLVFPGAAEACADLALNAMMLTSARQYLSDYCDDIQLHFTSAVAIAPGESAQILHRDRGIWGGYLPRKVEPLFSTIWATTPFTRANGATQVVPGSQYWDKDRQPEPHEIAYAEMEPGSVLCYTGTVLHGGGANSTPDQVRTGVFMHYALSWLRQEENQYLSCPPEHARRLSPELRALIGYAKGGYVLGFYSDPDDPSAAYESVSPEHLFSQREERFGAIHGADHVVAESMK